MSDGEIQCVLLADRHHSLSEGIRGLLQRQFQAVVTVADEAALVESAVRMKPNLVVADLALTQGESFGWLRRLLNRCPGLRVIVLSAYDDPIVKQEAFEAGAVGVVLKHDIAIQLPAAVREVLAGGRFLPSEKPRPDETMGSKSTEK